jgi:GDP-D-mannose dehydratase
VLIEIDQLGWRHKTNFEDLVKEMMEADLIQVRREQRRRNRYE